MRTVCVHTGMDGREHEGPFLLGGDADTPSKLVAFSVKELTRHFKPVNMNIARTIDLAAVVAPMNDERLVVGGGWLG